MPDALDQWLESKGYKPQDKIIFTGTSGVVNPQNLAEKVRAEKYGAAQADIDIAGQQKKRVMGSPFGKILNDYIAGDMTLEDAMQAAKLQSELIGGPQKAASVLSEIMVPAMEDYAKENPPYPIPLNYLVGLGRSLMPDSLRPKADAYFRTQKALKALLAKGLLGNTGTLTAQEQKDPLELMPMDSDSPQVRKQVLNSFKKLLESYK